MPSFGEILRSLRSESGMTQQELADRLWISKATISYYEQARRCPSIDMLVNISKVFHVSTDYLLGQETRKLNVDDLPNEDIKFLNNTVCFLREKNDNKTALSSGSKR